MAPTPHYHCVIVCQVSSQLHTFASIYFTLYLGSTLCPWFSLQVPVYKPHPFCPQLVCENKQTKKKPVSINPLE